MKKINEEVTTGAVAGIGAPPVGADPSTPESKKYAEPGVPPKQKKRKITQPDAPLNRRAIKSLMGFKEWIEEESKHDVRGVTGKMVHISKQPVRKPSGKIEMEYPGKSSSSGGGD